MNNLLMAAIIVWGQYGATANRLMNNLPSSKDKISICQEVGDIAKLFANVIILDTREKCHNYSRKMLRESGFAYMEIDNLSVEKLRDNLQPISIQIKLYMVMRYQPVVVDDVIIKYLLFRVGYTGVVIRAVL